MKTPRLLRSVFGRQPLFDGLRITRWLRDALDDMGPDRPPIVAGVDSLLSDEERLQLFVPITDFFGYDVHIPADDPAWVLDRTHRHVMQFVHDRRDPALDQLSPRWDDALAFSARATSSFPLAFPPVSIADYARAVPETVFDGAQRTTLFGSYPTGDGPEHSFSPELTHFVDGGVLDNKPFATTLAAIKLRPAATEVDRRLIYVEPDPSTETGAVPDGTAPGLVQTDHRRLCRDPQAGADHPRPHRSRPAQRQRRPDPRRHRDQLRPRAPSACSDFVADHGGGDEVPAADQLGEWRSALSAAADAEAGYSYPTYLRLRLRAVLDGFAKLIITRQEYSPSSAQALFVQRVLSEWAESQEVFAKTPTATDLQRKLIDTLDLARLERQIRFLIAALSWWYKPSAEDRPRVPDRQQLDQAKHDLYRMIDQLNGLARLLRRRREHPRAGRPDLRPRGAGAEGSERPRRVRRRSQRRPRPAASARADHDRHPPGVDVRRARCRSRPDHRVVDAVGAQRAADTAPRLRLLGHHPVPDPGGQRRQRARPRRGHALQPVRVRARWRRRRRSS